jgi:hypothetical protein
VGLAVALSAFAAPRAGAAPAPQDRGRDVRRTPVVVVVERVAL